MGPLISNSSDGDSRQRKLFVQIMSSLEGQRFRPIPIMLGFIFSCPMFITDASYEIYHLMDSDYIHNHKKLTNHLDNALRILRMGQYVITINHLRQVYEGFPAEVHGITRGDIDRDDRQNFNSVQCLTFSKVQNCLRELIHPTQRGNILCPSLQGTLICTEIVWYYAEIFCSEVATLQTRIKYAAIVSQFLGIWHNWTCKTRGLDTKNNFISRESYTDVLLSCHFTIILICYQRDKFPHLSCNLQDTGTDCVESF